jgi:hypothetical protein
VQTIWSNRSHSNLPAMSLDDFIITVFFAIDDFLTGFLDE